MRLSHLGAVLAAVAAVSVSAEEQKAGTHIPSDVFAGQPRGPYRTGTIEEMWLDARREETTTSAPGDKRRLMVQIWYPAAYQGNPPRAPYAIHGELYAPDDGARCLDNTRGVLTTSVLKAPLAAQSERFPVLIYNPGAGHPSFSATFQTEFLASHGYVVVGIGHTGLTGIERFPDGISYRQDVDEDDASDEDAKEGSPAEGLLRRIDHYAKRVMSIHMQDISFVLDRLQAMDRERGNRFHQRLDFERVGSLGWSLGGALSLQATRDEPRIKAAVNLDGWLYTDVQKTGTHRPIMLIHGGDPFSYQRFAYRRDRPRHWLNASEREEYLVGETLAWQLFARTDADWYDITLQRAEHGHFSDCVLFEPVDTQLLHPRLAHDIANRLTLEFFDKYLRQRSATPLLSGELAYPEVEIRKSGETARQIEQR